MDHLQLWKKMYIKCYKKLLQIAYSVFSLFRKHNRNKIVIALYRSEILEGNLKYVYKEILKQIPNAEIHLVYGQNKMNLRLFTEIFKLSNAKYVILDDYYLPIYLIKIKHNLKVIQLWHAAGAFKKFGYSTVGTKFGPKKEYLDLVPIHKNYTHVYVSTKKVIDFYAEAFNMSKNKIYPIGLARIDLFNHRDECSIIKGKIYQRYPHLSDKEAVNILIAPTYRANGRQGETSYSIIETLLQISPQINQRVQIIFKAHPYTSEQEIENLRKDSKILVAEEFTINEWMLVADAFVTDFSSAVFEFALLYRPIAHMIPDMNEYETNRGLYQDISLLSDGVILNDEKQLLSWINNRKRNEYADTSRMVKHNFDDTSNITEKIVKHFTSE
ncbi:CDP-glycerol glycerophosphotransferase family protein [Virgibacillus pantothenticus]|uniref:CDP-glycerol glycerophosphotransferase family protein n=2 Tax=Virgibacillus pantothenticus TaxID=1473 RepID=UPI001C23A4BE|nr:CDP-glycerol glycerophosphotransferase family protein [Virgibacillus pantothenticus]MBU8566620.1 CDP-glycerol glycerophosphotransferase family protein [Virgibacillus pantothenticus]MBU8599112.1 CDP-glycerol glycerophosphotransferase family protein [Virgibacillus pantothenticus]MBU8634777.1 CDP-glycerol glycerophosphotransferase family protein [Virgibacillus pantothenticus]MBU8641140.1 CDP-glycerol glycerophosphotransferase family protein [Virgibacillus pantothenticus]MBU8645218.1 CDP-glycer